MTSPAGRQAGQALVDVGSTMVKVAVRSERGRFSEVTSVPRSGRSASAQVRDLLAGIGSASGWICSSVKGTQRVGVIALSRRHSLAAAVRAARAAGSEIVYAKTFADAAEHPLVPVDVLVVTGGVDGGDQRELRRRMGTLDLGAAPHGTVLWAGTCEARDLLPDTVRVANVLDRRLRPAGHGLEDRLRALHLAGLADAAEAASLTALSTVPVWPTPAVMTLGLEEMVRRQPAALPPAPFIVIDVGGATTTVHYANELCVEPVPQAPFARRVLTTVGVATASHAVADRLAGHPRLYDFLSVTLPSEVRGAYIALGDGHLATLPAPLDVLGCVFLALDELTRADAGGLDLSRLQGVHLTGGTAAEAPEDLLREVLGMFTAAGALNVRREAHAPAWMYGLEALARRDHESPAAATGARRR